MIWNKSGRIINLRFNFNITIVKILLIVITINE